MFFYIRQINDDDDDDDDDGDDGDDDDISPGIICDQFTQTYKN